MLVSEYTSSHSKNPHSNKEGDAGTPNVSYTQAELSEWKVMYRILKPEKTCQADSTGKIERPVQRGRSSLGHAVLTHVFLCSGILTSGSVHIMSDFRQQGE